MADGRKIGVWSLAALVGGVMAALSFCFTQQARAAEGPDFFRVYRFWDLAECLDQFKEREFFECIYGRAFVDKTSADKFMLGLLYHHGLGVPRDPAKAVRWYREAAAEGYRFHDLGDEADKALESIAETAQGADDPENEAMAEEERTALAADGEGQLRLASRFWRGLCAPLDWEKARDWEIRAAESGNDKAVGIVVDNYFGGDYAYPRDPARALTWLEKRTADGDSYAGLMLGDLYSEGQAVPQDYARALELYEQAAADGHFLAWGRLYHMYDQGLGVERNEEKLALLRERLDVRKVVKEAMQEQAPRPLPEYAAEIYREGLVFYRDDSAEADYFQAGMSFADAAGLGVEEADCYFRLGWIQEHGLCGQPNVYAAGKHYRIASLFGHAPSMMRLARMHEEGLGVRRSRAQAERWYAAAAAAGEKEAEQGLERLRSDSVPDDGEDWEASPEFRKVMEEARYRAGIVAGQKRF